jgi:hypothetical protein
MADWPLVIINNFLPRQEVMQNHYYSGGLSSSSGHGSHYLEQVANTSIVKASRWSQLPHVYTNLLWRKVACSAN